MKQPISRFMHLYFDAALDLRVRIFNVMVLISACFCLVIAAINGTTGKGVTAVLVNLGAALFCAVLLVQAKLPGRVAACLLVFIFVSFFLLFPYLFFNMGGYHGGIPAFLVFAPVFTMFLLEGRPAIAVTGAELLLYAVLYRLAYRYPAMVKPFADEGGFFTSNLMDLLVVGVSLAATMYAQMRLYRAQQRRVDEQNAVLAQANRAKTQFLANASHEMRTPLTVASVDIQTVMGILRRMDKPNVDPESQELLRDAQAEIMRLSRMVGGMLSLNALADTAATLAQARRCMAQTRPDLIILDIMLPDGNGLDLVRSLRDGTGSGVPILLLTGLSTQEDVLRGLKSGGDDYLTKPYDFEILLARVEALLRRAARVPERIVQGRFVLDVAAGSAALDGVDLLLTQKEFALLLLFLQNPERYIGGEYLYEKIWNQPLSADTNALKSAVKRLRSKIEGSGWQIVWSRGEGYCFERE